MVLIQKWPCFQLFFLRNIAQENILNDILERENASLGYKNMRFKKSKNCHFFKQVNPWFWSKNGHFSHFFFRQYSPKNSLNDILERKNAFRCYKNKKFKNLKNSHFFKVVNPWFWSKNGHFSKFFFYAI